MKVTPFHTKHTELRAHMADFGGYNMPIHYTGVIDEHLTVRDNAGVFDVSHMGEFLITGIQSVDFLQYITTNDVSKLENGNAQYTCMLNDDGGIIDDLIIYCLKKDEQYMMVVNASNIDKDFSWASNHNTYGVKLENISDQMCLLAIQGPNANKILQPLTSLPLDDLKFYTFSHAAFAGVKDVIISATGYTGAGGVEIYFKNEGNNANKIWDAIFKIGGPQGLKPIGLAARDTLRLEMGYCLYGNDMDDQTSPLEAGLGWIVKLGKGAFIGKEKVEHIKEQGIRKKLVGIELIGKGIPRHGFKIFDKEQNEIGYITSGTQSPSLKKPIALGYILLPHNKPGEEIFVQVRQKMIDAKVVKVPFK